MCRQEAGETYVRCAQIAGEKLKELHDCGIQWENAAKAFKNVNIKRALECYQVTQTTMPAVGRVVCGDACKRACRVHSAAHTRVAVCACVLVAPVFQSAVDIWMESNKFSTAAKIWKEIGAIQEKEQNNHAAMASYQKAGDCYEADNNAASNANGMFIKVADLAAEVEDYKKAIQIYEKVSKSSVESSALRWSVKDHLFKALLCHFAIHAPTHKLEPVSRKLEQYVDMCPNMDNTREKSLIEDLIADFDAASPDDYADHVFKFDEIMPLDRWKSKVLLQIKKCLEGGNPEDGVGV